MKVKALITALGLAVVAPVASADTAQLELLPRIGGAEITRFVKSDDAAAAGQASATTAYFYAHTGGVSPQ